MNILILENSTKCLSLALYRGADFAEDNYSEVDRGENIVDRIDKLLASLSLDITKIDFFSIGIGPGSFTGLRIVTSVVKGINVVLKKPLIVLSSFISIAEEVSAEDKKTVVLSNAYKERVYAAVFEKKNDSLFFVSEPCLVDLNDFLKRLKPGEYLFTGESIKFKDTINRVFPKAVISGSIIYPKAKFLINQTKKELSKKNFTLLSSLEPEYIYTQDCQVYTK
jgi:tRNA threonylcarbamoyladenosine biosynthesis protein TsaB